MILKNQENFKNRNNYLTLKLSPKQFEAVPLLISVVYIKLKEVVGSNLRDGIHLIMILRKIVM